MSVPSPNFRERMLTKFDMGVVRIHTKKKVDQCLYSLVWLHGMERDNFTFTFYQSPHPKNLTVN
jgi:hypothetical protein